MEINLAQKAISLALQGLWKEANEVNLQILKENPEDVDALNRLARSYAELGNITQARATAQKVIKIDPLNSIATKCLEKWMSANSTKRGSNSLTDVNAFLEEPGKTKIVDLVNLGETKSFVNLDPGEEVKLSTLPHRVSVLTNDGKYIGRLPDDLAARLKQLIKSGNKYLVLIKSIEPKEVTVFIRETQRSEDHNGSPSFPTEKIDYVSFTPPELVHKEQPLATIEELDDA